MCELEPKIIRTNKKYSLILVLISLIPIVWMMYYLFSFFTIDDYQTQKIDSKMFFLGIICFPIFAISFSELIKPSIILLINEKGIQFNQGFRYFYCPWENIVYFGDNSSSRRQITCLTDYTFPHINKQISVGFINHKDVVEKDSIFKPFLKGINGEINININTINYDTKEILNILEEYSKKYNPAISIVENTNIIENIY